MSDYEPWKIYAKQMMAQGHGFALWQPAPSDNYHRVEVGDVGYVQRGHFTLLFKAACELGTRRRGVDVPEDFVPLNCGPVDFDQPRLPRTCMHTLNIQQLGAGAGASTRMSVVDVSATFSFHTKSKEGAALLTNHPTYVTNARHERRFISYIKKYHKSWLRWARDQGHDVEQHDIRLVTGHDLTQDFAMFAFAGDAERELNAEFKAGAPIVLSAGAYVWGSWISESSIYHNRGPQRAEPPSIQVPAVIQACEPGSSYSQCVFFRSYRMRYRGGVWPRLLKAGAGPHQLNSENDEDDHHSTSSATLCSQSSSDDEYEVVGDAAPFQDPNDAIFDYIFTNCMDSEAALVHDLDIARLVETAGGSLAENMPSILSRIKPQVTLDEDLVAHLDITNPESQKVTLPSFSSLLSSTQQASVGGFELDLQGLHINLNAFSASRDFGYVDKSTLRDAESPMSWPAMNAGHPVYGWVMSNSTASFVHRTARRRGKLPKQTTDHLKEWLRQHRNHPYPSEDEKKELCRQTGMSMSQIANWMINARRRILAPAHRSAGRFSAEDSTVATQYSISREASYTSNLVAHAIHDRPRDFDLSGRTWPGPLLSSTGGSSEYEAKHLLAPRETLHPVSGGNHGEKRQIIPEDSADLSHASVEGHHASHPKSLACSVCSKEFSRPSSLRIHGNVHTMGHFHDCPFPGCRRTFNEQANMRRHAMRDHGDTESAGPTELDEWNEEIEETYDERSDR